MKIIAARPQPSVTNTTASAPLTTAPKAAKQSVRLSSTTLTPTPSNKKAKTPTYDPQLAWNLAEISHLTYLKPDEIQQKTQEWGFTSFTFFDRGGTEAFLIGNTESLILSFRGTEVKSIQDFFTNGYCTQTKACAGKVHAGFWQSCQAVWPDIETAIQQQRSQQQLILTGHSLGGALAVLAADQFQRCGHDVNGVYTFGCPRIGDRTFAMQYNRRLYNHTYRLVNHKDVVPHLPPNKFGYAHIGQLIYFDVDGRRQAYPHPQDDDLALFEAILDHDMNAYKNSLKITAATPATN
jgi:triacylglycerol lipase